MKRAAIALGLVVATGAALAGGFFLFQKQIAGVVFTRALAENMGRNTAADLPDGLHVFMCGTGSPLPDPARAGPCAGVVAGDRAFLFDAGSGGARRLARMGFPTGDIERVYLTHLHSDHFDGLGEVMLQAWVGGHRTSPLPVSGPAGVEEVTAGFSAAYRIDSTYRTAHHGAAVADPNGFGVRGEAFAPPDAPATSRVLLSEGDLVITAFLVDHAPISPAYGYRVNYKDRSVVFSGDTVYSESLIAASTDADVLFHEALQPTMVSAMSEAAKAAGQANVGTVLHDILDYHASPEDAARSAAQAGVSELVLYHIVPPLPSPLLKPLFLGDAKSHFDGPIIVAEDGLLVSLPAGGDKIDRRMVR